MRRAGLLGMLLALALVIAAPAPAAVVSLSQIGRTGDAAGDLRRPISVAIDTQRRIYMSENGNHRVSVFEGDGRFAFAFGSDVVPGNADNDFEVCTTSCKAGAPGDDAGELSAPGQLTVDTDGRLYVIDGHRVNVFDVSRGVDTRFVRAFGRDVVPGDATGLEVCTTDCKAGESGDGPGQLSAPSGIAVGPTGREVYVSEFGNQRVSVFGADGSFDHAFGWDVSEGGTTGFEACDSVSACQGGTTGGGAGQLHFPKGLALDAEGLLYVADTFNARVSVFDPRTPAFVRAFGLDVDQAGAGGFEVCTAQCKPGIADGSAGQVGSPTGIELSPAGVHVVEAFSFRVSRFGPAGLLEAFGADVNPDLAETGFEVCTTRCKTGERGSAIGAFDNAQDVAVDACGAVWIADFNNDRLQRFGERGTGVPPCLPPRPGGGGAPPPQPQPQPPPAPRLDVDRDGVLAPKDCNDADAGIHPGARDEPRDRIDQDCDGRDADFPLLARSIEAFSSTYSRGRYTRFTSMAVKPVRRGDRLRLTCKGPGCEMRKATIKVRKNARRRSLLRHLKGSQLRKGAVVQLRVMRQGSIARVATWSIRAPKVPRLTRSCLPPGATKPGRCPSRTS